MSSQDRLSAVLAAQFPLRSSIDPFGCLSVNRFRITPPESSINNDSKISYNTYFAEETNNAMGLAIVVR
jgi:hypothetical protein